ncbi:Ataxin-10 [Chelonia mydas]|uniref:Ataxin-10 n=1 Tax=Chelonia mydas TaxID=8469 RepID=M7BNB2_CHEMY|nr:Ataxin-10 [Chelonia mydas]
MNGITIFILGFLLRSIKTWFDVLLLELWFLIVTDHLLKCPELVKVMYAKLSNQERITLLELIMAKISEKNSMTSDEMAMLLKDAEFLASLFQEKCRDVLKLTSAANTEDEVVVLRLRLQPWAPESLSRDPELENH